MYSSNEDIEKDGKNEESKWDISGAVIFIIGIFMLLYSFFMANNFVVGSFMIDEAFLIRFIFLISMILIGVYLINKGATSIVNTKTTGLVLLSLGLILLIFVFFIANIFIIGQYEADASYLARFMFFFCMIGIGIFVTKKGYELKRGVLTG